MNISSLFMLKLSENRFNIHVAQIVSLEISFSYNVTIWKKHEIYETYFAQSLIMQICIITKVHVLTYFSASMLWKNEKLRKNSDSR